MSDTNKKLVLQGHDRQDPRELELYYAGRPMDPEPVLPYKSDSFRFNGSLQGVAAWLALGHAQTVILEPGDVTRYELMLVPAWNTMTKIQGCGDGRHYMFVSYLVSGSPRGACVIQFPEVGTVQVSDLTRNEWARTFIAWWLNRLWEKIEPRLMPMDRQPENPDHELSR